MRYLPKYNGLDDKVMLLTVPLGGLLLNLVIFGSRMWSNAAFFFQTTLITTGSLGFHFVLCGGIAVLLKKRFPTEDRVMGRLALMIVLFLILSGWFIYLLFQGYSYAGVAPYPVLERRFAWTYFALGVFNIFLTLLMEGISRFQEWEAGWQETEKLNQAIKKSQLEGLKSQVNPHFLFNSLNSLSSLIQEDETRAEQFLDEISKVYRYMLRDDAQWVPLHTELKFIRSYLYLLNARFGEALQVHIELPEYAHELGIAPLTLQVIIENAFSQNIVSKNQPLQIEITLHEAEILRICNTVQPKTGADRPEAESGLDHLVAKYRLLKAPLQVDDSQPGRRCILIPLIPVPIPAA